MPRKNSSYLPNNLPLLQPEQAEFAHVPALLAQNRVQGFEKLRDHMLEHWESMVAKGINPYSALKMVIEFDRHAMFAEIQAAKLQGRTDMEAIQAFQDYLKGKVDAEPPSAAEEAGTDSLSDDFSDLIGIKEEVEQEEEIG